MKPSSSAAALPSRHVARMLLSTAKLLTELSFDLLAEEPTRPHGPRRRRAFAKRARLAVAARRVVEGRVRVR